MKRGGCERIALKLDYSPVVKWTDDLRSGVRFATAMEVGNAAGVVNPSQRTRQFSRACATDIRGYRNRQPRTRPAHRPASPSLTTRPTHAGSRARVPRAAYTG